MRLMMLVPVLSLGLVPVLGHLSEGLASGNDEHCQTDPRQSWPCHPQLSDLDQLFNLSEPQIMPVN